MIKKPHFAINLRHKFGRREFLFTFCGSLASFIVSCKSSNSRKEDNSPLLNKNTTPTPKPSSSPNSSQAPSPSPRADISCTLGSPLFDLTKIDEGNDTYNTSFMIYGTRASALIAFKIVFFNDKVSNFYLTDEQGRPFVHRFINLDIDQNLDQTYKTFVFDNLNLEGCQKIVTVFQTDGGFVKKTPSETFHFATTFRGLEVRPSRNNFVFKTLCYTLVNRVCQTAISEEICPFPELIDCTITNLSGEVLSEHGYNFTNIIDNSYIAAYKLAAAGSYYERRLVCFS